MGLKNESIGINGDVVGFNLMVIYWDLKNESIGINGDVVGFNLMVI